MCDLISRQAAIDELEERIRANGYSNVALVSELNRSIGYIMHLPSVNPVKHGKWKPFDLTWGRSVYACSACGEAFEVPTEMGKPIYTYCPTCGARMEAEDATN